MTLISLNFASGCPIGSDENQFVFVDGNGGDAFVGDRHGGDAEVGRIVDDGLEHLAGLRALDGDSHVGIAALEFGEDLGEDVQATAFVGGHHDFSAGHAVGFGHGAHGGAARLQSALHVGQKNLSRGGDGNLATGAVQQLGADLFFHGANLRGDRRLGAKALFGRAREAQVARHLQKRF